MKRSKELVIVSHCVLNQNSVVEGLARAKGGFKIVEELLSDGMGIIQLPCPELKLLGSKRKGQSKNEYDTKEYRALCGILFLPILDDLKAYRENGYKIKKIIGINQSPSCSITGERGIFMEEIFKLLEKNNFDLEYEEIAENYCE
ncbi:MAG: CD3072 family TudS-related putative desulfidase [Sarcina sp.]